MARTDQRLQQMAANHHVVLLRNRALTDDDLECVADGDPAEEFGHYVEHPVGAWLVRCECDEAWPANTGVKGQPIGFWWLCPRLCNLSQRAALRFLRDMDADFPTPGFVTRRACLDKLGNTTRCLRRETLDRWDEIEAATPGPELDLTEPTPEQMEDPWGLLTSGKLTAPDPVRLAQPRAPAGQLGKGQPIGKQTPDKSVASREGCPETTGGEPREPDTDLEHVQRLAASCSWDWIFDD